MRMTSLGRSSKAPRTTVPLVIFSVGGRRLAARAGEVGGIWPWTHAMPVPSRTPFVNAILRRDDEVMPVFDLAQKLCAQVNGAIPLCLIAKHHAGPMAICIDGEIPTLHVVDFGGIRSTSGADADIVGTCSIGDQEIPVYSLVNLGVAPC